jgi:hypothetical protein
MLPSSHARVFSLSEWPVAVGLVTAARMAELSGPSGQPEQGALQALSRTEALWLFDRCSAEAGLALRAFIDENVRGVSLSLLSDPELAAFVRKEIAVGSLLAVFQGTAAPKRFGRRPRPAESAPVPLRRAPPPPPAAEQPADEDIEFLCPGPQALALVAAAEGGVPFCEECARAAALRAAGGA